MSFKRLGLMLDCSRDAVRTVETVKKLADLMSEMGFNTLMLYTEDTYEIKERPYFGYLRGRYSQEEIKEIDGYCRKRGIELIPCIQTLAHLSNTLKWKEFEDIVDCNDIMLVGEEKTYRLIDDMLRTLSETFTTKIVHIGMDEAGMLGMGKYREKHGFIDPKTIMREHLTRVATIAEKYGLKPLIWSDMLFQVSTGECVPNDILPSSITPVYWDYYSIEKSHFDKRIAEHKKLGKPFWYAGGLWTWTGFAPHNMYSIRECKAALSSCKENGVENVFFTMWGDMGSECSVFSVLPSMYYVSQYAKGIEDEAHIKQGFKELTGIDFDDFILLDIPEITNSEENYDKTVNPDRYTLYNDYFMGIYDSIINENRNHVYKDTALGLKKLENNADYGFIFKTVKSLCNVLAVKNDLGIRTRRAYCEESREKLEYLLDDYIKIENLLIAFLDDFKSQWYKENKPFGFEKHEMRLGGLIQRTRSCRQRLEAYIKGEINRIEEIEEEILDPYCENPPVKREIWENMWNRTI